MTDRLGYRAYNSSKRAKDSSEALSDSVTDRSNGA
jgi:hypothetical protein